MTIEVRPRQREGNSRLAAGICGCLLLLGLSSCADDAEPSSSTPRAEPVHSLAGHTLLTGPKGSIRATNYVVIEGKLGVNPQGCFTLGGDILVARFEASILPSGKAISLPGIGERTIGESVKGLGGYYDTVSADGADACLAPDGSGDEAKEQFVALSLVP